MASIYWCKRLLIVATGCRVAVSMVSKALPKLVCLTSSTHPNPSGVCIDETRVLHATAIRETMEEAGINVELLGVLRLEYTYVVRHIAAHGRVLTA
jgi:8-oxo-dGTP pyrophosphatase MutT (NUDIX family)